MMNGLQMLKFLTQKFYDKFKGRPWCKEGDYICYGKHSGTKFFYKGIQLLLIFDDDVKMVVEDSKDLDPTYNLSN